MSQIVNNPQQGYQDETKENSHSAGQERTGYYNDANLQSSNLFLTKTASIAFLELQGINGRKFHLPETVMRQILLPDHANQNQNSAAMAGSLLKRIHLQKIIVQQGPPPRPQHCFLPWCSSSPRGGDTMYLCSGGLHLCRARARKTDTPPGAQRAIPVRIRVCGLCTYHRVTRLHRFAKRVPVPDGHAHPRYRGE